MSVVAYKRQVAGGNRESHLPAFTGLQGDLVEAAQTQYVGSDRGYEVAAVEQHGLHTLAVAGVPHRHRDGKLIGRSELGLVDRQVGIFKRSVALMLCRF